MYFLILIIGALGYVSLSRRISLLEGRHHESENAMVKVADNLREKVSSVGIPFSSTTPVQPNPAPLPTQISAPKLVQHEPVTAPLPVTPTWLDEFVVWIKEDWLMKVGGLLVLLGFMWFVTYAFMNGWIDEQGRILLGLILGAAVMVLGFWRIKLYRNQGSVFLVLGASIVLMTVFAARFIYDMFTVLSTFGLMSLAVVFVALAAVRFRVRMLAFVGLIIAGIVPVLVYFTPALINIVQPDYVAIFSYLAIVTVGVLWVVLLTEWRDLLIADLALVSLYSVLYFAMPLRADIDALILFAYGFVAVFFSANVVGFLRARVITEANIVGAVWNGAFLLTWVLVGVDKEWQPLVLSFWTIAFLAAATLLYRISGNTKPLVTYGTIGVALLGVATAIQLDGVALLMAYTLEVAVLVLLVNFLLDSQRMTITASLLFALPGFMAIDIILKYPYFDGVIVSELLNKYVLGIVVVVGVFSLLGLLFLFAQRGAMSKSTEKHTFALCYLLAGYLLGYFMSWKILDSLSAADIPTMLILTAYTVVFTLIYWAVLSLRMPISAQRESKAATTFLFFAITGTVLSSFVAMSLLEGALLGTTLTIFVLILIALVGYVYGNLKQAKIASFFLVIPAILVFDSLNDYAVHTGPLVDGDLLFMLFFALVLIICGVIFRQGQDREGDHMSLGDVFITLSGVLMSVLLWFFLHRALDKSIAVFVSLSIYTLLGITGYILGRERSQANLRHAGLAYLIFVVGHLLLVDMSGLDMPYRIVSFAVVGVLLMTTAFIGKKSGYSIKDTL